MVLKAEQLANELVHAVCEAEFEDSSLVMCSAATAIWIHNRPGELMVVMRKAVAQAQQAGLSVAHIGIESAAVA